LTIREDRDIKTQHMVRTLLPPSAAAAAAAAPAGAPAGAPAQAQREQRARLSEYKPLNLTRRKPQQSAQPPSAAAAAPAGAPAQAPPQLEIIQIKIKICNAQLPDNSVLNENKSELDDITIFILAELIRNNVKNSNIQIMSNDKYDWAYKQAPQYPPLRRPRRRAQGQGEQEQEHPQAQQWIRGVQPPVYQHLKLKPRKTQ
jgi:hypothetical protein